MAKKKYIVEYDPISWTGYGAYLIKKNDMNKTPVSVVFIALGEPIKAKQHAKETATKISKALHFYDSIKNS
ncbi:hypothetical protein ACYSNM_03380 [Myroides sp. LJL116]